MTRRALFPGALGAVLALMGAGATATTRKHGKVRRKNWCWKGTGRC